MSLPRHFWRWHRLGDPCGREQASPVAQIFISHFFTSRDIVLDLIPQTLSLTSSYEHCPANPTVTMATFKVVNELIDDLPKGFLCALCKKDVFALKSTSLLWKCGKCGVMAHNECHHKMESHNPCGTNQHFKLDRIVHHDNSDFVQVITAAPSVNSLIPPAAGSSSIPSSRTSYRTAARRRHWMRSR